jgi:FkbM family methyltransferase
MNIVEHPSQTLNGGYGGLFGEVVTEDCYGLKKLDFVPDVIFDIGANVGIFTRYAKSLFPKAFIVAVEPDPENLIHLKKFTQLDNMVVISAALGTGQIYHATGAANGAHEVYISKSLGYSTKELEGNACMKPSEVFSVSLADVFHPHVQRGDKILMKIDCEGGENCLWEDPESMALLSLVDYIAMELHYHGAHGGETERVREVTDNAINSLVETHYIERDHIYVKATKRI